MQFSKIMGIAYYEFRMQWRRRGLVVITLALLVMMLLPALIIRTELGNRADLDAESAAVFSDGVSGLVWGPLGVVLAMIMPLVLADIIPRDKQLGMRELIDTIPISSATYLTGKLLGGWISVLASMGCLLLIVGSIWWFFIGHYDLVIFFEPWLVGGVPMVLINIGLIIMLAAGQRNTRSAVVVGLLFTLLLPGIIGFTPQGNLLDGLNPLRPGIFYRYAVADPTEYLYHYTLLSAPLTIITGLIQVVLLWIGILAWQRYQESKQI